MPSTVARASLSLRTVSHSTTLRPVNAPRWAAFGPLYSVPHIGCAATKRPRRACIEITSHNSPLIEPMSITTCLPPARLSALTAISGMVSTGVASTTRSASGTPSSKLTIRSARPSCNASAACSSELSTPSISSAMPWSRRARANEPPIRPRPAISTFIKRYTYL